MPRDKNGQDNQKPGIGTGNDPCRTCKPACTGQNQGRLLRNADTDSAGREHLRSGGKHDPDPAVGGLPGKTIEKAILVSDLGINPTNDGKTIRLVFPELTEERRKELVKDVKKKGEGAKVAIRNIRRDANDAFKKLKSEDVSEDEIKGTGRADTEDDRQVRRGDRSDCGSKIQRDPYCIIERKTKPRGLPDGGRLPGRENLGSRLLPGSPLLCERRKL